MLSLEALTLATVSAVFSAGQEGVPPATGGRMVAMCSRILSEENTP